VPDLTEVLTRVERLERQNRRLKRAAVAVALLALAFLALGHPRASEAQQKGKTRVVEAERFIVRDADGKMRAALGMSRSVPGMAVFDENEKQRVGLYFSGKSYGLVLNDAQEKALIALETDGKGGAGLTFREAGQTRVNLSVGKTGQGLEVHDDNGKRRALL